MSVATEFSPLCHTEHLQSINPKFIFCASRPISASVTPRAAVYTGNYVFKDHSLHGARALAHLDVGTWGGGHREFQGSAKFTDLVNSL